MKSFMEVLVHVWGNDPDIEDALGANWCEGQTKHLLQEKWVEWALRHSSINFLVENEGVSLTQYYEKNGRGQVSYEVFLRGVAMTCGSFLRVNGVQPDEATKRFQKKMGY